MIHVYFKIPMKVTSTIIIWSGMGSLDVIIIRKCGL